MTFRIKTPDDFRAFHRLLVEYEAWLPPDLRHGSVPGVRELRSSYAGRNAAFLAKDGSAVAGCVAVTEHDADTAIMLRLFVLPQHRGAGHARALVGAALVFLRERGFARIVLDTDKERLVAAYRLYTSLGFTECEQFWQTTYPHPTFMQRAVREID